MLLCFRSAKLNDKPNECDKQDIPRVETSTTARNPNEQHQREWQFEQCRQLPVTQITSRIAALTFTTNVPDHVYKSKLREISDGLKRNFPDQYKIFNVSQKRSDLGRSNSGVVVELGWPDNLSPPLDRLCSICKQIENWLASNSNNIAIIHCKGWLARAAIVVAAYLHYTNICYPGAETVADKFSMQLFSEKYLNSDYGQPSHKRYLKYFSNLLLGSVKVNPSAIFLTQITLSRLYVGKIVVLKIYERMKPIYTSSQICLKDLSKIDLSHASGVLALREDSPSATSHWDLLFQCQFNTCALDFGLNTQLEKLIFFKEELDVIFADSSVDNHAAIELAFLLEPPKNLPIHTSKPVVTRGKSASPVASMMKHVSNGYPSQQTPSLDFSRADSYENFDRPEGGVF
uniref:Phosphatase tensin-type domain-containing protein n=1 Tax=Ditylenchus dipsaci TaxID=166011 RepID=A0A915DAG8_9BILA